MPTFLKKFVLKHTFQNVSDLKEDVNVYSHEEEHFGVPWRTYITRKDGHLSFYLNCAKSLEVGKWSVDTNFEVKGISRTGSFYNKKREFVFGNVAADNKLVSFGWEKFIEWEEIRDYLFYDELTVGVHVTIKKMTGFHGANLKSFDDSAEDVSDFTIVVDDKPFNVSKLFLAAQSTCFKSLFAGDFKKESGIIFSCFDPDDFQKYLEVLYGELAISETTVEGILLVAVVLKTPTVVKHCEEFLIDKSKKSLKKKLKMTTQYNLPQLKKHCLASMKSNADVRSGVPSDISKINRKMLETLFQKLLSIS